MSKHKGIVDSHYLHRQLFVLFLALTVIIVLLLDQCIGTNILGEMSVFQSIILILVLLMFCNYIMYNVLALVYTPRMKCNSIYLLSKFGREILIDNKSINQIQVGKDFSRIEMNAQMIFIKRKGLKKSICIKQIYTDPEIYKTFSNFILSMNGIEVKKSVNPILLQLQLLTTF